MTFDLSKSKEGEPVRTSWNTTVTKVFVLRQDGTRYGPYMRTEGLRKKKTSVELVRRTVSMGSQRQSKPCFSEKKIETQRDIENPGFRYDTLYRGN